MTILNDPETLGSVLAWGEKNMLTPGKGGVKFKCNENPILVACQQDFRTCMDILFSHGYRIEEYEDTEDEDVDEYDQVKEYLKFQAYSNIHYISLEFTQHEAMMKNIKSVKLTPQEFKSLETKDPIRRTFQLMEKAKACMQDFQGSNELKSNYATTLQNLEAFTEGILTQCKGINEIRTLLDHNPEDDDDDELDDAETNWQIALNAGYKGIVSHPNFEQYLWKKIKGPGRTDFPILNKEIERLNLPTSIKLNMRRATWCMKNIPLTLFTFLFCYPAAVFLDLFKNADMLFVSPTALRERLKKEHNSIEHHQSEGDWINKGCLSYIRNRMHIPMFRMVTYFFIQTMWVGMICFSVLRRNPIPQSTFEITIACTVNLLNMHFLLDDIIGLLVRPYYPRSGWRVFSLISHLIIFCGFFTSVCHHYSGQEVQWADLPGSDPMDVELTFISLALGFEFLRTLQWLVLSETIAPVVICSFEVIKDALRLAIISIIVIISFGLTFTILYRPFFSESTIKSNTTTNYTLEANFFTSRKKVFESLFWRVIETTGPEAARIKRKTDGEDYSVEFRHLMGLILWYIFQWIAVILLVNLFIAVMNNSFSNIWLNARKESKFSKSYFEVFTKTTSFEIL